MRIHKKYEILFKIIILFLIMSVISILINHFFKPFWSMIIIFIIGTPINNFLINKNINRKMSAVLSIFIINAIFIILITLSGRHFYSLILLVIKEAKLIVLESLDKYLYYLDELKKIQFMDALNILQKGNLKQKIITTASQAFAYVIGNVACFFIFAEKKSIRRFIEKVLSRETSEKIITLKDNIVRMVIVEMRLIIFSTIEIIAGFMILGINNALFLGTICGLLDILPYVGTIIIFLPIIIYNFYVNNYFVALGLIALYILVEIIREVLEAKFLSNKLKIHPIIILLSIYIGMEMYGFIGVIFGPLYCIIVKDFILDG